MSSTTTATVQAERIALRRLWWVGPLTIIASVVVNLLIAAISGVLFTISPEFSPLKAGPIILWTVIGTLGATLVFALLARFSRRPIPLFQGIAVVVGILSLVPDIMLLVAKPFPGTNALTVGILMLMHIVTAVVAVGILTALGRAR